MLAEFVGKLTTPSGDLCSLGYSFCSVEGPSVFVTFYKVCSYSSLK